MTRRTITLIIALVALVLFILQYLGAATAVSNKASSDYQYAGKHEAKNGLGNLTHVNDTAIPYRIVPHQSLILYTEPKGGISPVLNEITDATVSVDLVMYELNDPQVENALLLACKRGVHVRVLLNQGLNSSTNSINQPAYSFLQSHNVPVEWASPVFALTHQKTLIIDGKDALIMTFNLVPKYYATSRDFGVLDSDTADVNAIEQTFSSDWNAGNDAIEDSVNYRTAIAIPNTAGDDLVWSPGSKSTLLSMINTSKKSLLIYNEEMNDPDIISALASAAERGVDVQILMTDSSDWHAAFTTLANANVHVHTYSPNASLYIHAKMILSDGTQAFIGSQNFSTASMEENRELGLFISTPSILSELETTFAADWQGATPFVPST